MNIRKFKDFYPQIDESCYIDQSAIIIGQVSIKHQSSIWCNSVIRGDVSSITIGENTNIQDLCMLHVTHNNPSISKESPIKIGNNVTVGHHSCLHGCTINNNVLIGMGSIILDNAIIEDNIIIGAGSVVAPNKQLESGFLYFGNPLKKVRKLTTLEINYIEYSAKHYINLMQIYRANSTTLSN